MGKTTCIVCSILMIVCIFLLITMYEFKVNLITDKTNVKLFTVGDYISKTDSCKSLISINTKWLSDLRDKDKNFASVLESFQKSKNGLPYLPDKFLFEAAKELNNSYSLYSLKDKISFYFTDIWSSIRKWPFSPCNVFQYEPQDVKQCFDRYSVITQNRLRIAFLGDSMIRPIMEEIVKYVIDEVKLRHCNSSEDVRDAFLEDYFLDKKFKSNICLHGNGIELRLYWASYIMNPVSKNGSSKYQGAKEILYSWALKKEDPRIDPIPDILYIGTGMWNFKLVGNVDDGIDDHLKHVNELFPLLDKISQRTQIFWHVHPTFLYLKKFSAFFRDSGLHWMNQISYMNLFKNEKIWFWETLAVFSVKEKLQCVNLINAFESSRILPFQFRCHEVDHPGLAARRTGINMIFNVACNRILNIKENHCCQ
ncbi:UNVERIFIED_CONTAM: hypothetical protein RMT77_000270 [Armadillidium vulgare]